MKVKKSRGSNEPIKIDLGSSEEIVIKPKTKVGLYDTYDFYAAQHQKREGWDPNFRFRYYDDVGLGVNQDVIDEVPSEFYELYNRFLHLGFIHEIGDSCVMMSCLLRRILRLHGFAASIKQVNGFFINSERNKKSTIGLKNTSGYQESGMIDAHVVCVCQGYVLDFALLPLHHKFGLTTPRAIIGLDVESDDYQDVGNDNYMAWQTVKPQHPLIKHTIYEHKSHEIGFSKEYFRHYQF